MIPNREPFDTKGCSQEVSGVPPNFETAVFYLCLTKMVATIFFSHTGFNTVLKSLVAWIRSSLLQKIQWLKHYYLSE